MIEEWKEIDGYGNYQVSNLGNIRNSKTGRNLKPQVSTWGYSKINLSRDGKHYTFTVHRLVAKAFLGEPPIEGNGQSYEVNHKDGNKLNSALSNLEYVTKSENISHFYREIQKPKIKKPSRSELEKARIAALGKVLIEKSLKILREYRRVNV